MPIFTFTELTRIILIAFLLSQGSQALQAQCNGSQSLNLYWKGGSGNFNDATRWWVGSFGSGVEPCQSPRSGDNVYFTAAAFPSGTPTIMIDQNSNCKDMVWDNAISGATPTLSGLNQNINLDIFGQNFELATNLNFNFNGHLRFACPDPAVVLVRTRNQNLKLNSFTIMIGASTELRLLDALTVNNPTNSNAVGGNNNPANGVINLNSGYFNTNGQNVSMDMFRSTTGIVSRRINWDNSKITVDGIGVQTDIYSLQFAAGNNSGFSAVGSHLRFENTTLTGRWGQFKFGSSPLYDSITFAHNSNSRSLLQSNNINANYFAVAANSAVIVEGIQIITNVCSLGVNTQILLNGTLSTDQLNTPTGCQAAYLTFRTGTANLQKRTAGNLTFTNLFLSGITGVTTGGRTYTANNSRGVSSTNIAINAPTGCISPLYFRDNAGNNNWNTLNNWRDASNNPVSELPSVFTDVIFDGVSFPNTNKFVNITATNASAKSMTWTGTPANADINLTQVLYIAENLSLAPDMLAINDGANSGYSTETGRGISFLGTGTLQTYGKTGNTALRFMAFSDYTLTDLTNCALFYAFPGAVTRATNITMNVADYMLMARRVFDNVQVYMAGSGWNSVSDIDGSLISYLNNSTFYFNGNANQHVGATLPNVVVNNPNFRVSNSITVRGNLTFNQSCNYSMQIYSAATVSLVTVTGDVNIAAGVEVVMSDAPGSFLRIGGNLNMVGTCNQPTTLRTYNGNQAELRVLSTANVQFATLIGMNSINPITANNSTNGGGNSANITFTSGVGTTYYWRADRLNAADFTGLWSNPNHWTTNPANLIGDGGCLPTAADDVVFDNLSFSGVSNGCTINGTAFCKNFTATAGAILNGTGTHVGNLYINGNFSLVTAVAWNYTGAIYFIGAGSLNIQTANKTFNFKDVFFNNAASTWTLQNHFIVTGSQYGALNLLAGNINANNFNITIGNRFFSSNTSPRSIALGTGTFSILANRVGDYWFAPVWDTRISTNMTVTGGTILLANGTLSTPPKDLYMGNLSIANLVINDLDETIRLFGNSAYGYANFNASVYVDGNNTFDSLALNGGYTYRLRSTTTQTLNAPHGKIKTLGVGSSSFINMESSISNSVAFIRKPYGEAFCVDFVKVKDVRATKETNLALVPTTPIDYQVLQPFLEFQTGTNSDSISIQNDDWGVWAFNLSILVSPNFSGANSQNLCRTGANQTFPLSLTGTSPYLVTYSWADNLGNTGNTAFTATDDDANPSTPFVYQFPLPNTAGTAFNYNMNVKTSRCGDFTSPVLTTRTVTLPSANTLVAVNRTGACTFNNEPDWYTLVDNAQQRPIVSLQDKVNAADVSALGSVSTDVYFDASVQTYNYLGINYPYLQRHWTITPANNGQANVRLYFTQAELNALSARATYNYNYFGTLRPATDLQIFKFSGNAVGVGAMTIISPTLVPVTGAVATPFSSTANVYCLEFSVSSFSHFIVVPTASAILPLELLSFDAKSQDQKTVDISWSVNTDNQTISYEVQRSANAVDAQTVANVPATASQNYSLNDAQPLSGVSYYRIKELKRDGTFAFSDWKSVEIRRMQIMEVFPVPAKDQLNIRVRTYNSSRVNTRIYDNFGRLVAQQSHTVQPETMELLNLNTDRLANGIYTLQCVDAQGVASSQVFEISR